MVFPDSGNHVNTLSLVNHAGLSSANMSAYFVVALNPVLQPCRIISREQVWRFIISTWWMKDWWIPTNFTHVGSILGIKTKSEALIVLTFLDLAV
jgi:hypothetical protein